MKILIIEDERELASTMGDYLKNEHFICEFAHDFKTARDKILVYDYDCILLDITLPGGSGLELLKMLKKEGKTDGVLIISAKNSLDDKLLGLKLGADDYLLKPFHLAEMSARVHAIVRRRKFDGKDSLVYNEITLNTQSKRVFVNKKEISLTKMEFELLIFLIGNKNRVVSKEVIAEHLTGDNADFLDNFDFIYSHIKNLKRKLTEAGGEDYIKTVYGLGYKWQYE